MVILEEKLISMTQIQTHSLTVLIWTLIGIVLVRFCSIPVPFSMEDQQFFQLGAIAKIVLNCLITLQMEQHGSIVSIPTPKPSLKIGSVNKAFLLRYWQRLKIFFRDITFLFFKNLFEKEFRETLQNFNSIRQPIEKWK